MHLNGDEAMCFGAAFIASNQSASFKVRKVYLTQHPLSAISIKISPANESRVVQQEEEQVAYEAGEEEGEQAAPSGITYKREYQLYKMSDYLGQKKSLSLNYDTNMQIDILTGDGEKLATFTVNGLDEIANSELQKKENVTKPRVTLSFELSRSGIL